MGSKYITISQTTSGDSITTRIDDVYYAYDFYIDDDYLSLNLTEVDSKYCYMTLAMVLTFGEKYWHNICISGGSSILPTKFCEFIDNNITKIERGIKIEKIIE